MAVGNSDDAHQIALEWTKQIITLSSGIIVFSGTFVGTFAKKGNWSFWLLGVSWLLLLASIVSGLETISAITSSRILNDEAWIEGKGRTFALATKACFVCGLIMFIAFSTINFRLLMK